MGRALSVALAATTSLVTATKISPAGYMGEFGTGLWRVFYASGTFVIPAGITSIRVRVLGAGCGGTSSGRGGCGGGYAHGVFTVVPGASHTVTIGAGSTTGTPPADGGTSSFGALISATGGSASAGGVGVGGDFRATGGVSGNSNQSGGGGAGSQLGDGGSSFAGSQSGGGAVGGGASLAPSSGGASPFGPGLGSPGYTGGPSILGVTNTGAGIDNPINAVIRFPFDGFTGSGSAGGGTNGLAGGIGCGAAGGTSSGGDGGHGGGGGGGGGGGKGGRGGGGGGGTSGGKGGDGLVIVEW